MNPHDPVHERGCRGIFEALSDYLDGELSPGDCERLEEHVADCAPCIEFLETLKKSVEASREISLLEAPPQMPEELKARLAQAWQESMGRKGAKMP